MVDVDDSGWLEHWKVESERIAAVDVNGRRLLDGGMTLSAGLRSAFGVEKEEGAPDAP